MPAKGIRLRCSNDASFIPDLVKFICKTRLLESSSFIGRCMLALVFVVLLSLWAEEGGTKT